MNKLCSNSDKMDRMTQLMEKLEASMHTLQVENDTLKKELEVMKRVGEATKNVADGADLRARVADTRSNDNEQYARNYNVRIYNIPEPEKETATDCEKTVLKLFHQNLGLTHIEARDLDAVHRLGRKKKSDVDVNGDKGRGIIVRFVSRRTRQEVISKRRLLKKTPGQTTKAVTITEDLTKNNYILYSRARGADCAKECWTSMGKVFIKTKSGSTVRLRSLTDLAQLEEAALNDAEKSRHKHRSHETRGRDDQKRPRRIEAHGRRRVTEKGGRGAGFGGRSKVHNRRYRENSPDWYTDESEYANDDI
jgi:hypothetical protein